MSSPVLRVLGAVLVTVSLTANAFAANPKKVHRLAVQVNSVDPVVMNQTLNNVTNAIEYYRAKGESVTVDVVAFGPGLNMLRSDTSPVQDRIKGFQQMAAPATVQFSACNNTMKRMEKEEGHPISLMQNATVVPSGVVRLIDLQEQGWTYIRP